MTTLPDVLVSEVLVAPSIRHGFFSRRGGVSAGLYASLNCGLGSQDEKEAVVENRRRVAAHLGARPDRLLSLYQIHSTTALIVDGPFPSGEVPRADALVTATPGLVVAALAADCAPVLFADAHAGVVAAAHAGWRGAVAGILEATVAAMESIGAERTRIAAAVGPAIGPASYEVGPEFEASLLRQEPASARFFTLPAGKARAHFDLPGYIANRLAAHGIGRVGRSAPCTYENESLYFSYRRGTHRSEPDYGRQISAIVLI